MKKTQNVKGHGFMRKTKAFGLASGIALGATLLIGANTASADEATTATPSTTATTNESKTVVVDEGLTETANKAKEAGLTVNAEPTKNIGTANTEEESAKLAEQAKKEVADQKAQIEKAVSDHKASSGASEAEKTKLKDEVTKNQLVYYGASSQLNDAGDVDFNNNKVTFGEFKSTKGDVKFINAPSANVDLDDIDSYKSLLNAGTGSQKEINTFYSQGNMFNNTVSVSDKKNLKAVPIAISEGEGIVYKLNYAEDSELGKLGVATVEKRVTLIKSPVNTGKVVLLADRYGSVNGNFLIGGNGPRNQVVKTGDWSYSITKKYLDKNGKVIDPKELTAKVYNKYAFDGKDIVKADDFTLQSTPMDRGKERNNVPSAISEDKSTRATYGGSLVYFDEEHTVSIIRDDDPTAINPYGQSMSFHAQKLPQADTSKLTNDASTAPTVKYHLVSYTVNKPTATNPNKDAKGLVEVHYVVDNTERTVLKDPVIQTPESPIGTKYDTTSIKLPTITKDGKTYEVVRSEGTEKGQVVKGKTVVTYLYKLKEEPKPTPTPTPTPTPVEKPTTIHIDGNSGKEIAPKEDGTKPFKNIDGYEPSPKDPKNVENPKGETVRVYKIVKGDVEVRYVKDDKERTVLKDPVADTTQAKVGTKYDTTDHKPITITKDGVTYELVRTEGNEKGDVVKGKTVVTYVYREVQKPITIHIDTEGNPVAPQEDGTKPFKEIEGYKPAPSDSKNVEDPKGVTVRVYDKVKPEAPQEAPKTPEKPQPQQPATQAVATNQLPHTGSEAGTALAIAGLGLLGLGALVYKKKEN